LRRIANVAGSGICLAREDGGKRGVVPIDQARLRAEVRSEREALELDGAEAFLPRLKEERDLRLAEPVDRLHRVADEEERAAVALLPAGGEAAQELVLRPGGVLVFVDQDVADAGVEREQQVGRVLRRAERAH